MAAGSDAVKVALSFGGPDPSSAADKHTAEPGMFPSTYGDCSNVLKKFNDPVDCRLAGPPC